MTAEELEAKAELARETYLSEIKMTYDWNQISEMSRERWREVVRAVRE